MGRTISTILSLTDRFSPTINNAANATKKFQGQAKSAQASIQDMKKAIGGAAKDLAMKAGGIVAGLGIANFAKESIELASNLAEVQNVVDTTFKDSAETINKFASTAIEQFGLSELQAKQFNGTMGSLLKSSGIGGAGLVDMSTKLTGLSADFASFYNLKPEEAFEKIKAGMIGSSEPLLSLGIDMRDAALEAYTLEKHMSKAWKSMSNSEKTQVRFNYLMEKGKDASGDFAKTSGGFANQMRIAENNFKSFGASLAAYVLPYINKALLFFNDIMRVVPNAIEGMKGFFSQMAKASNANELVYLFSEYLNDFLFGVLPRDLADFLSSAYNLVFGFFADVFDNSVRIAKDLAEPFMGTVISVKTFIVDRINEITGAMDFSSSNGPKLMELAFDGIKVVLKEVLDIARSVFDFFNNNWGTLEPIIIGVTGAIIGFNVSMKLAAFWTNTVKKAQKLWAEVMAICRIATMLLNGTLTLTPLGWFVIGMTGVVAVGFLIIKNWKSISSHLSNLAAMVKEKTSMMYEAFLTLKNQAIQWVIDKFNNLKEKVSEVYDGFIKLKDEAIQWTIDKFNGFKQVVEDNKTAIEVTSGVLGIVFAPAIIKTGVEAAIAGGKIAMNFITSIISTGTEATISGAKVTIGFISSIITTGIEAVISGAKLTANFIAAVITSGIEAVVSGAKIAASFIASLISAGAQAVVTGVQITASFIVSLVESGIQAGITAATITGQLIMSLVNYVIQGWQAAGAIAAQTAEWVIQTAQVVGATAAQIAQNVAVGAWNIICGIATVVTGAFGAVLAFLTSPIGLVVLAIGALIAIGVLLYENWNTIKEGACSVFGSIKDFISGVCDSIGGFFKGMINGVIDGLNCMIGALNDLNIDIPDWVPLLGGKKIGFSIPKIPAFAMGTKYAPGGLSLVGERGPEFVNLRKGDSVTPANETRKILEDSNRFELPKFELPNLDIQSIQIQREKESSKTSSTETPIYINFNGVTVGEEEWFEKAGEHIANKIKIALQR